MLGRWARSKGFRGFKGFTIVELLIVVIVIGVLASAGMAKYQGFTETARSRTCCANQATIENGVAIWTTQNTALCETCEGAQWFRRDGHSSSHGWSTPPPFSDSWAIAETIRDNKVFVCPKVSQNFGSFQNVPNGWSGLNCWTVNYVFYYHGVRVGGSWNGSHWYLENSWYSGAQIAFCGAYGSYSCNGSLPAKYKHSTKWN